MTPNRPPNNGRAVSYDVRVWKIRPVEGKIVRTYEVRWAVARRQRSASFKTYRLADSFRAELLTAARQGEAFDLATGRPQSMLPTANVPTWYEHACAFVDMKWPHLAPRSRQSLADALATVTPALLVADSSPPRPALLRETLYRWAFNPTRRAESPPDHLARAAAFLQRNTVQISELANPALARTALDTLARTLDGKPASANTITRKRAVLFNAVQYAVELGHLDANPLTRLRWKAPKVAEAVDRRAVVNHTQARVLLAAVGSQGATGRRLTAFFGCLYYAALRPAEATDLRRDDLALPVDDDSWGEIHLAGSDPATATSWTDTGSRQTRPLKHRADRDTRPVPCPPPLVTLLRRHLAEHGTAPDGRLFRGHRGGPLPDSVYGRIWQRARHKALTPAEVASPLAARPYDLRHAAVSTWLSAGVPATQVAEWAGHSVHVLLRVYAKCIVGQDQTARNRVERALTDWQETDDG